MSDVSNCPECGSLCHTCLNTHLLAAMAENIYGIERLPNESRAEYIDRIVEELSTDGPNV